MVNAVMVFLLFSSTLRTNIPVIAITGLNALLTSPFFKDKSMASLPPISQRIKSFFNTENAVLREASVLLFGDLVATKSSEDLREQALALFPCFLLHLADDDARVIKVSSISPFKCTCSSMGCPSYCPRQSPIIYLKSLGNGQIG